MKTVVIQSFRDHDIPDWIARCLDSAKAWALASGFDHWLADDRCFALCGDDYLAKVGDNKRSITNLARLELIRKAHADGYERAIWMDADVFVFDPAALTFPEPERLTLAKETYIRPERDKPGWHVRITLNNCLIVCPAGDPDLELIIATVRHVARHHEVDHNFRVGVELLRGMHRYLRFPLVSNVGMLSPHVLQRLAGGDDFLARLHASHHGAPIHAANLSAGPHVAPWLEEAETLKAMDALETKGAAMFRPLADQEPAP